MPERIIVTFHAGPTGATAAGGYLGRALALKQRADALGATLCAWSGQALSFDLAPDEIEEAVSLAALASSEADVAEDARFAVGVAHGEMTAAEEVGRHAMLAWGPPLLAAETLASIAEPGEVLVAPDLPAVGSGELLITGSVRGRRRGTRVRGLRLDVLQPLRRLSAETVARLRPPAIVARGVELDQLVVPPGCLGVIRANPGAGGTRLLLELIHRLAPSRALLVGPVGASREPLGAIRRALSRAAALGVGPGSPAAKAQDGAQDGAPALPERLREALARLLSGDGIDPLSAAALIDAWLAPASDRHGLLVVDDAGEIDRASLDAIATAMSVRGAIRAFVRLGADEQLPAPLSSVTVATTVTLGALPQEDAEALVRRFFGGSISTTAVRRWARLGAGWPLAVREALCEGLESGALRWLEGAAEPRRRMSARGPMTIPEQSGGAPARPWIERRLAYLDDAERAVLTALAMLGGDASDAMIDDLSQAIAGPGARISAVEQVLTGGAWVLRPEPGWLRLSSRSLRDTLLDSVPDDARIPWHVAASGTLRQHGGVLGLADAAWHALQGDDRRAAADLATAAARAAGRAMLEIAEADLLVFAADQHGPEGDTSPDSPDESLPPPTYRMPVEAFADLLDMPLSGAPRPSFDTLPEEQRITSSPPPEVEGSIASIGDAARLSVPIATQQSPRMPPDMSAPRAATKPPPVVTTTTETEPPQRLALAETEPPPVDHDDEDRDDADHDDEEGPRSAADPFPTRAAQDPLAKTSKSPVAAMPEIASRLADLAKQALVQGDIGMLERLMGELRRTGEHTDLVERMTGFISLGRGAKAEALQRLRAAAEAEQRPARRTRSLLAYGVALAASGRTEGALLEVLTALARAREADDRHGEHVCARFLARLSLASGHEAAARAWTEVAQRADPARVE